MRKNAVQVVLVTAVLVVIGLVSVWTAQPLLAPSLASAAFAQILSPDTPSARPWSNIAGQIAGVIGGVAGVLLSGASSAPLFTGGHALVDQRVVAIAIAVVVAASLQLALKATSPAGGATAIVVALGLETADLAGVSRLLVGIVLVVALGAAARQVVLKTK